MVKGKYITLVDNIKKEERFQVIDLTFGFMELEKEEKHKPKVRRNEKIIKIVLEINEIEYIKTKVLYSTVLS